MRPRHARAKPTRDYKRSMVASILILREDLDSLDRDGLCRSYGMSRPELDAAIDSERKRRAA